ncbi:hypothetical protein NIES298_09470 [Microcystis aeruginosa NIES-298]|nr:hypothetical protein NIES298_09470 [Microcystis aeruginosa NIES-298]
MATRPRKKKKIQQKLAEYLKIAKSQYRLTAIAPYQN